MLRRWMHAIMRQTAMASACNSSMFSNVQTYVRKRCIIYSQFTLKYQDFQQNTHLRKTDSTIQTNDRKIARP